MAWRPHHFHILLLVFGVCLSSMACGQQRLSSATPSAKKSIALVRIADEYWQHLRDSEVYLKRIDGLPVVELPDISEKKDKADAAFAQRLLKELDALKPNGLHEEDLLTLKILQWDLRQAMQWGKYHWLFFQIAPISSPLPLVQSIFGEYRFQDKSDLDGYEALLRKLPAYIDRIHISVREQAARGITLPKAEIPVVTGFLTFYLQDAAQSPFFVQQQRLQTIEPAKAMEFQNRISKIIEGQVNPAFKSLLDYVNHDYADRAPERVGLSQYPGGKEFYRFLVRFHTTLDISPEEVHRIGLESVQESEAKMAELRRTLGFQGSREEFHRFLKTDPRFFPKSPEEMEARLTFYLRRIEPVLGKYFVTMPKAPYRVQRLSPALEGTEGLGHYQQPSPAEPMGIYYYNGSKLNERSLLFAGHLALHELLPGHHFQMSLEAENKTLPAFRRLPQQTAYVEGWGDYASYLGQEMGIYENSYDLYGMLATDMRKSVRLVIDTGMNYMGWTREQAMEYMRQHTLDSETQIQSETLRDAVDYPGLALAYKMGSHKILELRKMAEREMGDKFNIREFHHCILGSGSMPLEVLDQHVHWCIEQAKKKSVASTH